MEFLSTLAKTHYIAVELGIESTKNSSLEKINRCHTFQDTEKAYDLLKNKGIHLGAHLILGLQGEDSKDFILHSKRISRLPIEFLKLHQLQIIKGTQMASEYALNPESFSLFDVDSYIEEVILFLQHLRNDIVLERFSSESPADMLIAPRWGGLKNFEITNRLRKRMVESNAFQGQLLT